VKSKTLATWIALLAGGVGLHRFYLKGWRDAWGWLHLPLTALGLVGLDRIDQLGHDDRLAWLLVPWLGVSLATAMLCAIIYGLTPDEAWDLKHNPAGPPSPPSGWGAVIGVVLALLVGATSLISTIAYSVQHLMEIQVESERRGSGTGTPTDHITTRLNA
jgi:hypothetical protein